MQKLNKDYTLTVLQHLREGRTEKEISILTHKHRNTVSRHVSWLRKNMAYDPQTRTNQIVNKLKERINDMTDRDLIHFLAIYMPQKIEMQTEQKLKLTWSWLIDRANPCAPLQPPQGAGTIPSESCKE